MPAYKLFVVKSFEYKIAISANFVQTVKNSIASHMTSVDLMLNSLHFEFISR